MPSLGVGKISEEGITALEKLSTPLLIELI